MVASLINGICSQEGEGSDRAVVLVFIGWPVGCSGAVSVGVGLCMGIPGWFGGGVLSYT